MRAQTGDPEAAADLTQQTFLDAYERLERLQPGQPFGPWLHWIARYNFLPWWRQRKKLPQASLEEMSEKGTIIIGDNIAVSDGAGIIIERDAIQQALNSLSPTMREALLLHELSGYKTREIAQILCISEAAAGRRVGRALAQFRKYYNSVGLEKG